MNKLKFLLATFVVTMVTLGIYSCAKENFNESNSKKYDIDLRSNNVINDNGILKFNSYQSVKDVIYSLYNSEKNEAIRDSLYASIGITTAIENSGVFYTDNPACYKLEQELNFNSKRRMEESVILYKLNNTTESVFSMVTNPYFKTILNQDDAFKVGKRYFRILGNGMIGIAFNNDPKAIEKIRTMTESNQSEGLNYRVVPEDNRNFYLTFGPDNTIAPTTKIYSELRIGQMVNTDGTVTLINESTVELNSQSNPIFKWIFSDGTTSLNQEKVTRPLIEGDEVKLTYNTDSNPHASDTTKVELRACALGGDGKSNYIDLGNGNFKFLIPGQTGNIEWVKWTFDDGSTSTSLDFNKYYPITSGPRKFRLCIKLPQYTGPCCGTFWVYPSNFKCNDTKERTDVQEMPVPGFGTWKIDCVVWVETSGAFDWATPGEVGSRTRPYKQKSNGGWTQTKVAYVETTVQGSYFDKNKNCSIEFVNLIDGGNNVQNVQVNKDHDGARMFRDELFSTHRFVIQSDGKGEFKYTKNGGKLILR